MYFILHFGISSVAAFLIRDRIPEWYVLAVVATFLGVAVLSNTNIKVAGYSLIPIADLFVGLKAKMLEQAAEDKASEVTKAEAVERLQTLIEARIENVHRAGLVGAGWSEERIEKSVRERRRRPTTSLPWSCSS